MGVRGKTCRVCLRAKQKCDASWGEVAAENSGFSVFSLTGMALLERLVAGVEKMGTELVNVNKKLGTIDVVLHEGAMRRWQRRCRSWRRKMRFSLSFAGSTRRDRRRIRGRCRCRSRCKGRNSRWSRSGNAWGSVKYEKTAYA